MSDLQPNVTQDDTPVLDQAAEARRARLKEKAGRFRILIIGRANAGKTTILKKICNTTDEPEIFTSTGEKINTSEVEPSAQRGLHNIENEMVFKTNPAFIFHDSRGFEAGGVDELRKVKDFVSERSKAKKLRDQVHVIWYCIPMDDDRPVTRAEREFFSLSGTGKVPVVVVFTKCEALEVKAIMKLEEQGESYESAVEKAPKYTEENLKNTHMQLQTQKYPPHGHVYLQELDKQDRGCQDLVECTAEVLNSDILQAVFISTQQNNLEMSMEYSLRWSVPNSLADGKEGITDTVTVKLFEKMMLYFPYNGDDDDDGLVGLVGLVGVVDRRGLLVRLHGRGDGAAFDKLDDSTLQTSNTIEYMTPLVNNYSSTPPLLQAIHYSCALAVVLEHLSVVWNHHTKVSTDDIPTTVLLYLESEQCGRVTEAVQQAFSEYQNALLAPAPKSQNAIPASTSTQSKVKKFKKFFKSKAKVAAHEIGDEQTAVLAIGVTKAEDAQEELAEKVFQIALANRLDKTNL